MNTPVKQTVYLPVKIEDEFPKGECVMISKTDDMLVGYPADVNGEIQADDEYQILRCITHWLKSQEVFVFTSKQLNELLSNVIKQTLETAAEKAETKEDFEYGLDEIYEYRIVDKQSITNTFEETFKKFEV